MNKISDHPQPMINKRQSVRILIVEDLPADAELTEREARKVFPEAEFNVVETSEQFLDALTSFRPDIILSDFSLPAFDGLTALRLTREHSTEIPFILITGSINEDTAVKCMKAGAWDYIIKEHIKRLGPVLLNAMDEKRDRIEHKIAVEKAHRWERVFSEANFGLAHCDARTDTFISVNRTFAVERGYTIEELEGRSIFDIYPPEAHDLMRRQLYNVNEAGHAVFETVHKRKDGSFFPVLVEVTVINDDENRPISRVSYALDISERKRWELKLQESEALFRNVFQYHAAVKLLISPDTGNIIDANDAAVTFYGWTREQLMQMKIQDINTLPPEKVKQEMKKVWEDGKIYFEFQHRLADGTIRDVEVFSSKIDSNEKVLLYSIIHDITERKMAEQALRRSEENLKKSQKTARLGSWTYDLKDKMTWSDELYEIYGVSKEDFVPTHESFLELLHPDDRLGNQQWLNACISGEKPGEFIFRIILKDGAIRYISGRGELIYDADGKPFQMSGTAQDITELKLAEAVHERLMAAMEQVEESIIITDTDGIIQYVNPAFEKVTGYSRIEAVGQNPRILKSGEHPEKFYEELWKTISNGHTWKGRVVNRHKKGHIYTEAAIISPIFDKSGKIVNYVAAKQDITEYLKLEAQFQQAQKMESMGQLAGGVAHDYNNMLSVIMGYTEMAMFKIDPADPLLNDLQEILNAALHSRDITRQLLAFARKETITPEVLDLNEVVEGMLKMLRRLIGEDINLAWLPGTGQWFVRMDPSQLNQILANLCINARDAIKDTGKIIIETDIVTFDPDYCLSHPGFQPGDFVLLAVSDNGCGMDKETIQKIFEPFFTTKELGRGTGLGLATVYGIVNQNHGFINVYSEQGKGSTFKVYLPRHLTKGMEETKKRTQDIPGGRGETVLVVEDEASILRLTEKILDGLGYMVLTAKTAGEAIDLANDYNGAINLLITDVIIPEMNGRELAERIKSLYPNIKCLFMSGYTADVIAQKGILGKGVNFIQKPFSTTDLAVKIRMVIEKG